MMKRQFEEGGADCSGAGLRTTAGEETILRAAGTEDQSHQHWTDLVEADE